MNQADDSMLLPLLFYRPNCATVPIMRLSLVTDGDGAPHQSIRKPFEVLNQTFSPGNVSILARLLPRYGKIGCYTAAFLFPPHDVNQFVDEFPEGMSHLAAVLLAFYALGADATLGGDDFRQRLSGWTASTCPDKGGTLTPVAHLSEKLAAIFEENGELERLGCQPVADVILCWEDRAAIAGLLGISAEELGEVVELDDPHVTDDEVPRSAPSTDPRPKLRIHFARNFADALRLVFGEERLRKYRRKLVLRKLLASKTVWAAVVALIVLPVGIWLAGWREEPLHNVEIVAETGVQAIDSTNRTLWRREMGTKVSEVRLTVARDGQPRIVVGLEGDGPAAGDVVALNRAGREIWRFSTGGSSPYTGTNRLNMLVRSILIDDVLPEPGKEVIITTVCQWYPGRACILSEDGRLLRELWHPGGLGGVVRIGDTDRLVFWGSNNHLRTTHLDNGSGQIYYSLFCVRAGEMAGQCPPYKAPGVPRAKPLWYKAITPQGRGYERITSNVHFGPREAEVELWVSRGWALYLDADGGLISRGRGEDAQDPAPGLLDVLAALDGK